VSVVELHRRTGISRTVLQGYESGKFAPGSIELRKVCEALGATPNKIIFGDERPLEKKSPLEEHLGDLTKVQNTARLGTMFQMLTVQEQSSLITLIESILIPRVGGIEKLKLGFEALDLVFNNMTGEKITQFTESIAESLPPDLGEKFADIGKRAIELDQDQDMPDA
jgi:transcriptional regulator with XRE-family HTH domain